MSQYPDILERPISAAEAAPDLANASPRGFPSELRARPIDLPPTMTDQGLRSETAVALPSPEAPAAPEAKGRLRRKLLLIGASLMAFAAAAYFGWQYWTVGRFEVSTDDAYVQADSTTIAPRVSGYLSAVLVGDNVKLRVKWPTGNSSLRDAQVLVECWRCRYNTQRPYSALGHRPPIPKIRTSRRSACRNLNGDLTTGG